MVFMALPTQTWVFIVSFRDFMIPHKCSPKWCPEVFQQYPQHEGSHIAQGQRALGRRKCIPGAFSEMNHFVSASLPMAADPGH